MRSAKWIMWTMLQFSRIAARWRSRATGASHRNIERYSRLLATELTDLEAAVPAQTDCGGALSGRLGSESGVVFIHHGQRPCARRRWLRDPSRSRLYKERSRRCPPFFHLSDNTPASAHRHRDRRAKPSSRLEGNAQRQMPTLWRGAPNLSARDIYRWRAETTDFAGPSRGASLDCLT
jgi:hypothetical protein